MASKVTLTFNSNPSLNRTVEISIDTGSGIVVCIEMFASVRSMNKQVSIGATAGDTSYNYAYCYNIDYPNYGHASANISQAKVTVTMPNEHWQISSVQGSAITDNSISFVIDNEPVQDLDSVELNHYEAGTDVCGNMYSVFDITGGTGSYNAYSGNDLIYTGSSPMKILLDRGSLHIINVYDTNDRYIKGVIHKTPRKLIPNDFVLDVMNLDSGATITINSNVNSGITPLSYSLDGSTYKTQNVFTGILPGSYTLYVKDVFGCVIQKPFIVYEDTSLTETVFTLSDINALHFASVKGDKKNIENTLSCNELKKLTYPFSHKFLIDDNVPTQFKTNAKEIQAYTILNGSKQNLPVIQKTENIGLEKKSTMTYFDYGGGKSAVYFGTVDILDPLTDAFVETIDLGFTLPEWANKVGQLVNISEIGQVRIDEIGYSDLYESFVLIFNINFNGITQERTLYSKYNYQPYEVYEVPLTMASQPEQFKVVIEAGHGETIDFAFVSETVKRVQDEEFLYDIDYWNPTNVGNMVYQTGIKHKLRLKGLSDYIGEQETEGYDGDEEYYVTDNSVYKTIRFYFPNLSTAMAHKLRLVVAHKNLIINGLDYKLSEPPEITGNINNNLKTFSVTLKCGGNIFLDSGQEIIGGEVESGLIGGALEASKGKSLILWTKQNG